MLQSLIASIAQFCIQLIQTLGYPGIFILMVLESMVVPLPSELVMPFAGFLAASGKLNFALILLASALGSLVGSLISYYIGMHGGHRLIKKYGKYLFLDETDLLRTEQWFKAQGEKTIFIGRFIPVVRHLISIPAGIGKMNVKKFMFYTIAGATIWNGFLAYMGFLLHQNWALVQRYTEPFSVAALIVVIIIGGYAVYRHVRHKRENMLI